MRSYIVVMRVNSGVTLLEGNSLKIKYQTETGPLSLTFKTRRKDRGLGCPTVLDLTIEATGGAGTLDEAISEFSGVAQVASALLALGANAVVEQPPVVEIAYDVTEKSKEHDFFQRRHPATPFEVLQGRRIHPSLLAHLYECFGRSPAIDRLMQAVVHYNIALTHWQPGNDLIALNHLWIGIETLTPTVLNRECKKLGVDDEGLYRAWGLSEQEWRRDRMNKLSAEVRTRIFFMGDRDSYKAAKKASDGFEHGYLSLKEARDLAKKARKQTAACLRRAVLELADVDQDVQNTLLSSPFDQPLERWQLDIQFRGKLIGPADGLAPETDDHPHFEWNDGKMSGTLLDDGDVRIKFEDQSITARFGKGVICNAGSLNVWGPEHDNKRKQS